MQTTTKPCSQQNSGNLLNVYIDMGPSYSARGDDRAHTTQAGRILNSGGTRLSM